MEGQGRRRPWRAAVGICALAFAACGGADVGPRDESPSLVADEYEGRWDGVTSHARKMSFAVDAAGVRSFAIAWEEGACELATSLTFDAPAPVTEEGLDLDLEVPGGRLSVEIRFPFYEIAAGEIVFVPRADAPAPRCPDAGRISFLAQKEPPPQ